MFNIISSATSHITCPEWLYTHDFQLNLEISTKKYNNVSHIMSHNFIYNEMNQISKV